MHGLLKEPSAVLIVGFLIEPQIAAVHKIVLEDHLLRHALGELLHSCGDLLIFDPRVFLVLGTPIETLPWE